MGFFGDFAENGSGEWLELGRTPIVAVSVGTSSLTPATSTNTTVLRLLSLATNTFEQFLVLGRGPLRIRFTTTLEPTSPPVSRHHRSNPCFTPASSSSNFAPFHSFAVYSCSAWRLSATNRLVADRAVHKNKASNEEGSSVLLLRTASSETTSKRQSTPQATTHAFASVLVK